MCSGCLACVAAAVHRSVDSNLANQLEEQLAMLVVIQGGPFLVPLNRLSLSLSLSFLYLSSSEHVWNMSLLRLVIGFLLYFLCLVGCFHFVLLESMIFGCGCE